MLEILQIWPIQRLGVKLVSFKLFKVFYFVLPCTALINFFEVSKYPTLSDLSTLTISIEKNLNIFFNSENWIQNKFTRAIKIFFVSIWHVWSSGNSISNKTTSKSRTNPHLNGNCTRRLTFVKMLSWQWFLIETLFRTRCC